MRGRKVLDAVATADTPRNYVVCDGRIVSGERPAA